MLMAEDMIIGMEVKMMKIEGKVMQIIRWEDRKKYHLLSHRLYSHKN